MANLLNERKIVRSSVAQFKEGENLPPLLFAGIILEGGIVSYDANIITGGGGTAVFFGGRLNPIPARPRNGVPAGLIYPVW